MAISRNSGYPDRLSLIGRQKARRAALFGGLVRLSIAADSLKSPRASLMPQRVMERISTSMSIAIQVGSEQGYRHRPMQSHSQMPLTAYPHSHLPAHDIPRQARRRAVCSERYSRGGSASLVKGCRMRRRTPGVFETHNIAEIDEFSRADLRLTANRSTINKWHRSPRILRAPRMRTTVCQRHRPRTVDRRWP